MSEVTQENQRPQNHPFSDQLSLVLERHYREHILGSGIDLEVAKKRGYRSVLGETELKELEFARVQRRAPGLLIPVYSPDGNMAFHQFRPDNPRLDVKDKPIKYETPSGAGMRLDVHPRCREDLKDPSKRIFVVEGIKKEDSLISRAECAIGLLGVWNFKGKNEFGGTTFLADWDYVALKGRLVYIVFDSDLMTKPEVRQALERLTEHLRRKGGKVFHIYLPSPNGEKVGVDDYLAQGYMISELLALAREPDPGLRVQTDSKKLQKTLATTFLHNGEWLVELTNNRESISFLLFNSTTGELAKNAEVQLEDGTLLVVPERNLIERNIVLLPSGVEEYRNENELFHEIRGFVNRYVEFGDFLDIVGLYVLLSWLFDRFTELPYLRFMGDYGTGKSRALIVVGSICYKPFFTFGASTVSPIFRLLDAFKGTLVLDEGDHRDSGMWNELVKILNTGFQANIPLLRTEGDRRREVRAYHVFGPKLIATRRPFHDDALESRCLTNIMPPGARRADIPINLPKRFYEEAESLRNKLLLFRLKNYTNVGIDESVYIPSIEDRLNQVFLPLFSIAKGEFRDHIQEFSKKLQERVLESRSQSLEGLTIKALLELQKGEEEISVKRVTEKLGELGAKEVSAQKAGRVIRNLGFDTKRSTKLPGTPYIVIMEANKLQALATRYGVIEDISIKKGLFQEKL